MGFVVFGGRPFDHKQNLHLIHILKSNDLTNMINKQQVWLFACLDMALNFQEPDVCCVNHGSIFMGNIYRDRQDITVPDLATADRNSKEVSVYYKASSTTDVAATQLASCCPMAICIPMTTFAGTMLISGSRLMTRTTIRSRYFLFNFMHHLYRFCHLSHLQSGAALQAVRTFKHRRGRLILLNVL